MSYPKSPSSFLTFDVPMNLTTLIKVPASTSHEPRMLNIELSFMVVLPATHKHVQGLLYPTYMSVFFFKLLPQFLNHLIRIRISRVNRIIRRG